MSTEATTEAKIITSFKRTITVTDVKDKCLEIADSLAVRFLHEGEIEDAMGAINAYRTACNVMQAQLAYSRMTGAPQLISFYES